MPSELEITGSPSVKIAVNKYFSEYFDEMYDNVLNNEDPAAHVLNCTNPSLKYKTFFIHIEAFRDDDFDYDLNGADLLDDGDDSFIFINGTRVDGKIKDDTSNSKKYFVTNEDKEIPPSCDPYSASFNDFGDYLIGFELTGIKSKMYLSGSDIVDVLSIDLYHYISEDNKILISKEKDANPYEKIDIESLESYTGTDLPPGGTDIDISDLINSREEFKLSYLLNIKANTHVDLAWFDYTQVVIVEIAILLPMEFEAAENEAFIDFTDYLNDIGGLINKAAKTEFIESMNLTIGLKPENPFGSGIFVIKDEHYRIESPMDNDSFPFILSNEDLEYINNTEFIPNFSIVYKKGNTLKLPNGDLIMSTISLKTKVKLNLEL
jgi:hypothetical protein